MITQPGRPGSVLHQDWGHNATWKQHSPLLPFYLLGLYYSLGHQKWDLDAHTWGVCVSINSHQCSLLMNASPSLWKRLPHQARRRRKKREHVSWQMVPGNRWQGGDRSGSSHWKENLAFPVQVRASHPEKIRKTVSVKIGRGGKRAIYYFQEKSLKGLFFFLSNFKVTV